MKAIVTGGGTGGHIYPAVAVGLELKKRGWEVIYIGSKNGLENEIVPKNNIKIKNIEVAPLPRQISLDFFKCFYKTIKGYWQTKKIIKKEIPDIVFGTGGFVAGPVVLSASRAGIPALIHEQNVFPGLTNKILSYFVDKIALNYKEAINYFPSPQNKSFEITGNPIRQNILKTHRNEGIKYLNLDQSKKTLLVFGGSQGSMSINQAMYDVCKYYYKSSQVQIIYITGENNYQQIKNNLEERGLNPENQNIKLKSYLHQMEFAYAAADLIVYRAGATGLAEITARGIPAILIPYPYATGNHQEYNARNLEEKGAALVITEKKLNGQKLLNLIQKLFKNTRQLKKMAQNSKSMGKPEATSTITNLLEKMQK